MNFSQALQKIATTGSFPGGNRVNVRWGQLIRANTTIAEMEGKLASQGNIVRLSSLGHIRGGVVTRANAYFLVREIPFDQIPARLRVTRSDLHRIAVIVDGLDYVAKLEKEYLKPVIKGPESLESVFAIRQSDLRLLDVKHSKAALEQQHANGVLAYLKRGETINYKTSDDDLKGGIPAQRSQIKGRRPYWYSLQCDQSQCSRIVFPEHIDRRYVFTLIPKDDTSIVIDKLYVFEPGIEDDIELIHAFLNTLYTWYQIELRGRSQLGEGVLELKKPDFAGLFLPNPDRFSKTHRSEFLKQFADVASPGSGPSLAELGTSERHSFDRSYLKLCGFPDPDAMMLTIERALRALAGERTERKLSVVGAKVSRRQVTNAAASVDAYAARLSAAFEVHPEPRAFVDSRAKSETVAISGPIDESLRIGVEFFDVGEVFSGSKCVARTKSVTAAQFVKGVLLVQPELKSVDLPVGEELEKAVGDWTRESRRWHDKFKKVVERELVGVDDARIRDAIVSRALHLLRAQ